MPEPICGNSTTLSLAMRSSATEGSFTNASNPAAEMVFSFRAVMSASSSTTEPRETLSRTPPAPSAFYIAAFTKSFVASPPGTMTMRMSAAAANLMAVS